MKNLLIRMCAGLLLAASVDVHAQPAGTAVPVTVDNFKRAETDMYLAGFVKQGALGKFFHHRELPLENTGVRPNRDTLYSLAVFDLDAGPVTITLPDAGKRFMSLMVINQDHYALETVYTAGDHTYTLREDRHALSLRCGAHARRSGESGRRQAGASPAGCDQGQPARRHRPL